MIEQTYCKLYRFNIDIKTCKSRLVIINKECDRHGLEALMKDQKKCWECQGKDVEKVEQVKAKIGAKKDPARFDDLICEDCGKKASEVDKFYPRIGKCIRCYQKKYNKSRLKSAALEMKS